MEAQMRARQSMQDLSDAMRDISEWSVEHKRTSSRKKERVLRNKTSSAQQKSQKELKEKEEERKPAVRGRVSLGLQQAAAARPRQGGGGEDEDEKKGVQKQAEAGSKAKHTYNNYRERWEKFDYTKALAEAEEEGTATAAAVGAETASSSSSMNDAVGAAAAPQLHPLLAHAEDASKFAYDAATVVRGPEPTTMSGDETSIALRSEGNNAYGSGEYARAVDLYQASIDALDAAHGYSERARENVKSAYSNMAMAYIKMHSWERAEECAGRYVEIERSFVSLPVYE